jgi:hypothetical protein
MQIMKRWLGRQDSNLGMAESKSDYFSFEINPHSKKTQNSTRYRPIGYQRVRNATK